MSHHNKKHSQQNHSSLFGLSSNLVWSLGIGLSVLLIIGFTVMAKSQSESSSSLAVNQGRIETTENNLNLGDISMANGDAPMYYQVTNTSSEPVTITKMDTSCMCTKAKLVDDGADLTNWAAMAGHGTGSIFPNQTIEPGQTLTVVGIFDPNAHGPDATGPMRRTITLYTNSQSTPELALNFMGNVIK